MTGCGAGSVCPKFKLDSYDVVLALALALFIAAAASLVFA